MQTAETVVETAAEITAEIVTADADDDLIVEIVVDDPSIPVPMIFADEEPSEDIGADSDTDDEALTIIDAMIDVIVTSQGLTGADLGIMDITE